MNRKNAAANDRLIMLCLILPSIQDIIIILPTRGGTPPSKNQHRSAADRRIPSVYLLDDHRCARRKPLNITLTWPSECGRRVPTFTKKTAPPSSR